ncbi:MAG: hypothetical protein V3S44_06290, partial [Alphaproteobacteria bacterium]
MKFPGLNGIPAPEAVDRKLEICEMNLTIKTKLVAIAFAAAAAMSVMLFLFINTSSQVDKADNLVAAELVHLDALVNLRLSGKEMILAAMDTLVDRLEGKILKERREDIDAAFAHFKKEEDRLREAALEAGEMGKVTNGAALADEIHATIAKLEVAILNDLPAALETQSQIDLDEVDEVIDELGEVLDENLEILQKASASELADAMEGLGEEVEGSKSIAWTVFAVGLA